MPQSLLLSLLAGVAAGLVVAAVFMVLYTRRQRRDATGVLGLARVEAERLRADARREAEAAKSQVLLSAKMDTFKLREDLEREIQRRRDESERLERRAEERARVQERKLEEVDKRERALSQRESGLHAREGEADRLAQEQRVKLERIAGLTGEDARREILQRVEDEARGQAAALVRDIKEQARRGADREARRIISMAIQRIAAEHAAESSVAAVALPNDEMKGRIIGREGRNIRAFEM
ncbi:MAG: Rnase Y domain-containing protein, partial [Gemmatimonadota bacterium]|nr:Rnase Y domain-containing protein [Gemmatimonadota bacterium]